MSKMKDLYEKVGADRALQEKFGVIMKCAAEAGEEATNANLAAFAKEAGYEVTLEEMRKFFKEMAESKESELSDVELDMVAGGKDLVAPIVSIIADMCDIWTSLNVPIKDSSTCNYHV